MKLPRRVSSIIYDLDGVLLDTECFYTEVTQEIVGNYGKVFDWSVKSHMIGRPSLEAARYLVEALDLPMSPEEYLARRQSGLELRFPGSAEIPGAERFTRRMHALGLVQGVGTSSERRLFELKTLEHREWFSVFASVVCGDDERVARGKPAPDIFLAAAADIGSAPEDCLVLEDSPSGVAAARAAGMQVIAMPDPAMEAERYRDADLVIAGFADLQPEDLGLPADA